jgi:hypothetical protein
VSDGVYLEIEGLLASSLKLLDESDWDPAELQQWGARREETFARLRGAAMPVADEERTALYSLIEKFLAVDAFILARLQNRCYDLSRKINDAARFRRSYPGTTPHAPSLLERVA